MNKNINIVKKGQDKNTYYNKSVQSNIKANTILVGPNPNLQCCKWVGKKLFFLKPS